MKLNQYGTVSGVSISLVVVFVLLIASLVFGIWSFSGRQKYKNNTDQLINSAVANAKSEQQTADNKAFAIATQSPLTQYQGPEQYGTVTVLYPKTWSSYVNTSSGGLPLDGYFYPGTLPAVQDGSNINFALRVQVESSSYADAVQYFQSEVSSNGAKVTAYSLPKVPSVVGIEAVGQLPDNVQGTMVVLPLRNEALEIWTEGSSYLNTFNSDILPNLSFSP